MSSDLCGKLEIEVDIKATAEKVYHIYKHKLHLHTATDTVLGVELHQGDWGTVGSVYVWNYLHDGKPKKAKEKVEEMDDEKKSIKKKIIEGDLMEYYKSINISFQVTPKSDGLGCAAHWTVVYEKCHNEIPDPHTLADLLRQVSKDVEAYLLQES